MSKIGNTIEHEGQAALVTAVHDDGTVDLRVFSANRLEPDSYLEHVKVKASAAGDASSTPAKRPARKAAKRTPRKPAKP